MKIFSFFVFSAVLFGQTGNQYSTPVNAIAFPGTTNSTAEVKVIPTESPLTKIELTAIEGLAIRQAALDKDREEVFFDLCTSRYIKIDKCTIDMATKKIKTKADEPVKPVK